MAAAGPSRVEEDISPRRSYAMEAHELARYRSQYSDATSAHHRASSRARSRQSLGPPKGLARVPFELKKFWGRQISVIVDQANNRDHLGTETLYSPAISLFLSLSRLGSVSWMFNPRQGVFIRRPGLKCLAAFCFFIVQGTGLDGGEATSAGSMLIVGLVHPSTQRMTTPQYGPAMRTSLHTRFISW
ncbi:hypothetical protein VE02_01355 [Pseudogymnoascus sp. 03VT05]|nr:hypothetical protein VE02_01355 [Pseudogymnoascus sp. 03VT05]